MNENLTPPQAENDPIEQDSGQVVSNEDSIKVDNKQEQQTVETPLSLDELSQKYAVNELCGPASMDMVKNGLQGIQWVSIFRESPFHKSEWEMFLGGYTTDSASSGAWKALDAGENSQYAIEVGMFREVNTVGGQKLIPTEKCLQFIQDRLERYTE